jgi:hypothetical protein
MNDKQQTTNDGHCDNNANGRWATNDEHQMINNDSNGKQ